MGKYEREKGARYMEEIWKPVVGYEGCYEVSNMGRVRSVERKARFVSKHGKECIRTVRAKELNPSLGQTTKRFSVMLSKKGKTKRMSVHRLVAMAFVNNPNPSEFTEVNHIDEDPTNNKADNLEWCNRRYNMTYGTIRERIEQKTKRCPVEARKGEEVLRYDAVRHVSRDGFCTRGVYYSARENKPYKGYYWRFI